MTQVMSEPIEKFWLDNVLRTYNTLYSLGEVVKAEIRFRQIVNDKDPQAVVITTASNNGVIDPALVRSLDGKVIEDMSWESAAVYDSWSFIAKKSLLFGASNTWNNALLTIYNALKEMGKVEKAEIIVYLKVDEPSPRTVIVKATNTSGVVDPAFVTNMKGEMEPKLLEESSYIFNNWLKGQFVSIWDGPFESLA